MLLFLLHLLLLLPCRKFKGAIEMPNIGYGTNKKDRHVLPNGFKKVRHSSSGSSSGGSSVAHGSLGPQWQQQQEQCSCRMGQQLQNEDPMHFSWCTAAAAAVATSTADICSGSKPG
jgi:hypothetical protein